jgi:hypothetical protein
MSSAFNSDLVKALENPSVNERLLEVLGGYIKTAAEKVRGHDIIEVSALGSPMPRHMVGQALPYDESKPRASKGCQIQNSVSHLMQQGNMDILSILNHVTEEAGYGLGAHMNGNCAGCDALRVNVAAQYSMSRDNTEIRFSANCKHGSSPVCPDQMWAGATAGIANWDNAMASAGTSAMSSVDALKAFRREYMQDHSSHTADAMRYMTEHGIFNTRQGGVLNLEPAPYVKPKDVVRDSDVEVEILNLDENYGLS